MHYSSLSYTLSVRAIKMQIVKVFLCTLSTVMLSSLCSIFGINLWYGRGIEEKRSDDDDDEDDDHDYDPDDGTETIVR